LILARERDPELGALELRGVTTPQRAAEICVRIAETGALEDTRGRALELVASAKAELPEMPARQRGALELIADGVVERYS
jgi:geranylgeranyl pyrophosphate synthase